MIIKLSPSDTGYRHELEKARTAMEDMVASEGWALFKEYCHRFREDKIRLGSSAGTGDDALRILAAAATADILGNAPEAFLASLKANDPHR